VKQERTGEKEAGNKKREGGKEGRREGGRARSYLERHHGRRELRCPHFDHRIKI